MHRLVFYIFIIIDINAFSQISGYVADNNTGEPLAGVSISTVDNRHTISDSLGKFYVTPGSLPDTIYFRYLGYKPLWVVVEKPGKLIHANLEVSHVNISEITVSSAEFRQKLNGIPGHISVVTQDGFYFDNNTEINHTLNKLPGIYMQSGSLNTNRLIIRGIGSRSPYSTNRVKAYYEDIPLTTGEGVTTIEDIDPESIGKIEIIRGPASGIYGAGLGGAINIFANKLSANRYSVSLNNSVGSFGLYKTSLSMGINAGKSSYSSGINFLCNDGYRENNEIKRNSFYLFSHHHFNKSHLKFFFYNINLHAYIPSSINKETFETNPRSAATNWLNISGFEDYTKIHAGITYNKRFRYNIYNNTTVFTSFFDQYESRPFNILKDRSFMFGLRSRFTYSNDNTSVAAGAELFNEQYFRMISETLNGEKGRLLTQHDEERYYYSIFFHVRRELFENVILTTGLNYNRLSYSSDFDVSADSSGISEVHHFKPVFSPRFGFTYKPDDAISIYVLASHGFSPPSLEETLHPEGMINPDIKPESGWNLETGIRGLIAANRLNYELSVYRMSVKNLLVTKRVTEDIFTGINAGRTAHYGFEASLNFRIISKNSPHYKAYTFTASSYFSGNHFISFIDDETDYSGNKLPGIPQYMFYAGFNREKDKGLNFSMNYQITGSMYLNDGNTGKTKSFDLLNAKISYKLEFDGKLKLDIFAGIYNILNTHYASMILVNAQALNNLSPRYYYPGLPLNFNAGIKIRFNK